MGCGQPVRPEPGGRAEILSTSITILPLPVGITGQRRFGALSPRHGRPSSSRRALCRCRKKPVRR